MKISVISLFPDIVRAATDASILGRAQKGELYEIDHIQLRDFAKDKHNKVDERPAGGGPGLVLRADVVTAAIESVGKAHVVLTDPGGRVFTQTDAKRLAKMEHVVFVCGRYEGFDARIHDAADERLSIGDYVLTGGELAAAVMIDATLREVGGVLGNDTSSADESHQDGRLEYRQYTKPNDFRGQVIPEVLLSGDHARIERARQRDALLHTRLVRPDLYANIPVSERAIVDDDSVELLGQPGAKKERLAMALVHYPCVDKHGQTFGTSITNLDVHDIARAARTFGLDAYYIVTPVRAQQQLAESIAHFWRTDKRKDKVPTRADALSLLRIVPTIEDAIATEEALLGHKPWVVATSAQADDAAIGFDVGRVRMAKEDTLLLFGTGYGLAEEALALADDRLVPVNGPGNYNHLSVRTAVAIIFDRLRGA